ncbi:hypothetical protein ACFW6U_08430 [Pseudomonas guariconensis]|uniref:hypothetical protein n=1 Tax=Pseudomonas guariconensis TaxID=1288410 RepID=UPI00366DF2B7
MTTPKTDDLVITVRLSAGAYTARARGEKATASSSISAELAARALASKLGHELAQLDLFAGDRRNEDGAVQFMARNTNQRADFTAQQTS